MPPPILSFQDIDIALNPGGQSCTDVTSSSCLIHVSVNVHRVKLFSMRSHQKSAVLLTTDQQFTSAHLIIDSFISNLGKLFSRSVDIIEVRSNCLDGLARLHLFSTSVNTVFFCVFFLLLLTFDISFHPSIF